MRKMILFSVVAAAMVVFSSPALAQNEPCETVAGNQYDPNPSNDCDSSTTRIVAPPNNTPVQPPSGTPGGDLPVGILPSSDVTSDVNIVNNGISAEASVNDSAAGTILSNNVATQTSVLDSDGGSGSVEDSAVSPQGIALDVESSTTTSASSNMATLPDTGGPTTILVYLGSLTVVAGICLLSFFPRR